jgi:hypothetical protein
MNQPIRSLLVAGAALAALLISEIGLRAVAIQTPAQPAARTISSKELHEREARNRNPGYIDRRARCRRNTCRTSSSDEVESPS